MREKGEQNPLKYELFFICSVMTKHARCKKRRIKYKNDNARNDKFSIHHNAIFNNTFYETFFKGEVRVPVASND